jgi:hypothetical protein
VHRPSVWIACRKNAFREMTSGGFGLLEAGMLLRLRRAAIHSWSRPLKNQRRQNAMGGEIVRVTAAGFPVL